MKIGRKLVHVMRCTAVCLLLCVGILTGSASPARAWDRDDNSNENWEPGICVGDTTLTPKKDGGIVIEMTATTATNSWRWRTIGFYVTDKPVSVNTKTITGTCPSNIPAKGVIWLDVYNCKCPGCPHYGHSDSEDRSDPSKNGVTYTTIKLSGECVEAHLKAAGIDPAKTKKLYFQGILAFYNGSTYKYGPFYSVNQAKAKNRSLGGGRDWAFFPRSSGEGWVKRYNMEMNYNPDPTTVQINYYRKNTEADKAAGATTTWTRVSDYNTKQDADKWTSLADGHASISLGNGLGFEKSDYYAGNKIPLSRLSAPRLLSQVTGGSNYDQYYVYRLSWSKRISAISNTSGTRKQINAHVYKGVILDADGVVTEDYKTWLRDVRDYEYVCTDSDVGLVINVCYKKVSPAADDPNQPEAGVDAVMTPSAKATIQSDPRGTDTKLDVETYDSTQGIPSSEPQYVNVYANDYLYTVGYETKTASKSYSYHEGCYEDSYTVTVGEGEDAHEETYYYWVHGYGSCTLTCDWEDVTSLGVWKIDHSDVTNKSLPDKTETLFPHNYTVNAPDVVYTGGVVSWAPYGTAPCGAAGAPNASDTLVKSGRLKFNGTTVLSDTVRSQHGDTHTAFPKPATIGNDVLYENGYVIPPTLANDTYLSKGTITYKSVVNTNTSYGNTLDYDITKINDVVVHTPTVSYAEVPNDAKAYCQLVTPSDNAQLVLDQYFTVCDNSYGYHSDLRGYGTRNYTKSASQFIAKKEVIFSFDVYRCNADGSIGTFVPAGTWTELDLITGKGSFYLPVWVNEGDYSVTFRSRTINCDANVGTDEIDLDAATEVTANTDLENYLSTSSIDVEVSGRLFDLTMYDFSDYPAWGVRVFRQPNSTQLTGLRYTVGLNDRNGNQYRPDSSAKYTFSLVDGSHPYLKNYGVLKPGYVQRFYLTTFGDMNMDGDYVDIRPTFYYVTGSGASQTRTKVDLYYDETIDGKLEHFVKVGSDRDKKNVKSMSIGDLYTSVPDSELSDKAALSGGTVADLRAQTGARYRYDRIVIPLSSATFVGDQYIPASGIPAGVDESQVKMAAQKWYFEYSLPANVHAVPAGTTVDTGRGGIMSVDDYAATYGIDYTEDFWCSGGYLVVNWTIRTVSSNFTNEDGAEGEDINVGGGSPAYRLDYINHTNWVRGFCNMWNREGYQYTKIDSSGKALNFMDGDVCMYYASGGSGGSNGVSSSGGFGSVRDDYKSYGTH